MIGNSWIELVNGNILDVLEPDPGAIDLSVVARGLAMTCRYAGQVDRFLSVAEHSILVTDCCPDSWEPEQKLNALLHDAEEAFMPDIPTPYKKHMSAVLCHELRMTAHKLKCAVHEALGVPYINDGDTQEWIDKLDKTVVVIERENVHPNHRVENVWDVDTRAMPVSIVYQCCTVRCFTPWEAEQRFINRFSSLMQEYTLKSKGA